MLRPKHDDLLIALRWPLLRCAILTLLLAGSYLRGVEVHYQEWDRTGLPEVLEGGRYCAVIHRGDLLVGSARVEVLRPTDQDVARREQDKGWGVEWAGGYWHSMSTERKGVGGLGWFDYPSRWVARNNLNRSPGTFERWAQGIAIPAWFIWSVLGALPLLVTIFHFDRGGARLRRGLCPHCGYDVHATPERCPECGQALGKN